MAAPTDSGARPAAEIYARYLPDLIIDKVAAEAGARKASAERFQCAALFADISGFTPLTERLADREDGAERLTAILNDYFSRLIAEVREHGGDILKFAGDSLIAIWRPRSEDDAPLAGWRAACCALAIQQELEGYEVDDTTLTLRVAVGEGTAIIAHLGGVLNRWEFIISGRPLDQVAAVSELIEPGGVGVARELWSMLESQTQARPQGEPIDRQSMRLRGIQVPPAPTDASTSAMGELDGEALRPYLPAAVVHRINAGLADYIAELRRLTILFVNLPELGYRTRVEEGQAVMEDLQNCCYRFEGSINKLSVDDKGVSLLAAMGLPPLAHADDPDRGLRAAVAMVEALRKRGVRCAIGISTGRVYCGAVGSERRQEYTIMGDSVNLAARLMQAAGEGILCDTATHNRAGADVEFARPRALRIKGKGEDVQAWPVTGISAHRAAAAQILAPVGRERERRQLAQRLDTLIEDNENAILILEGEAGMGKTRLAEEFLARARELPVNVHHAAAEAIEKSSSYFVWQRILGKLLVPDGGWDRDKAADAARGILRRAGCEYLSPLLNDILPLGLEDNDITRGNSGEVRAENTRMILVELLAHSAAGPHVLVIDDAHWMDSASWAALLKAVQELRPLLTLLVMRPLSVPVAEYRQITEKPSCERIALDSMAPDEITELVCRSLGVDSLPESAARLIIDRGEGHPYFSEELGYALRDAGVLEFENGRCKLAPGAADLKQIDLPETVEGIITSRVDRLSPGQAMSIKVASVIGRKFDFPLLAAIHPTRDGDGLMADLDVLEAMELTPLESAEPVRSYLFKHIITQEVCYQMMLHDQRRQLHQAIAEWYEAHHEDLRHHYPLVAHHWARAGVPAKAIDCLECAAEEALAVFANTEAMAFLKQALELSRSCEVDDVRKGYWLRCLGEAQRDLGRLDDSLETLNRALRALDAAPPASRLGLVLGIVGQGLRQLWSSYRRRPARKVSNQEAFRRTIAAEAYEQAQVVHYWRGEKLQLLHSCLRAATLAESTGRRPRVLPRIYGNLGIVTGVVPLPRAARYYCVMADRMAREDGHEPTLAWILLPIATYRAGLGDWRTAEAGFDEGLEITTRIGDESQWANLTASKTMMLLMQGRFRECRENYQSLYQSGRHRDDFQAVTWGQVGKGRILFRLGRYEEMMTHATAAVEHLDSCTLANRMDLHSLLAAGYLHRDDLAAAHRELMALTRMAHRPSQNTLYPPTVQFAFAAMEAARRDPGNADLATAAKTALRMVNAFGKVFRVGRPIQLFFAGLKARHNGRNDAGSYWRQALEAASSLNMPYEQALSCHALAMTGSGADGLDLEQIRRRALARMDAESVGFLYQLDAGGDVG